jgi:hypothetical protein
MKSLTSNQIAELADTFSSDEAFCTAMEISRGTLYNWRDEVYVPPRRQMNKLIALWKERIGNGKNKKGQ